VLTNRKKIRVEWGDCDPARVVFYPRYFAYFDACTHSLFDRAGLSVQILHKKYQIIGIPLVEVRARFIAPSQFGEQIAIESSVAAFRNRSFQVHHKLFNGDELAVEAVETRVLAAKSADDPHRLAARPIPSDIIKKFQKR
jgi:4-hydroxybenzoyl-CoA thioesterase